MKTIYKYPLGHARKQHIQVPSKAKMLSAGWHQGCLNVWAEVDPSMQVFEDRAIRIYPTGVSINVEVNLVYIDSVIIPEYEEVYHVYEEIE